MKTIYKYELEPTIGTLTKPVWIPHSAHYLHIAAQGDKICLWVEIDTDNSNIEHNFEVLGTGHEMHEDMGVSRIYIGTVMMCNESLVFHVYSRNE